MQILPNIEFKILTAKHSSLHDVKQQICLIKPSISNRSYNTLRNKSNDFELPLLALRILFNSRSTFNQTIYAFYAADSFFSAKITSCIELF
jgi:hypothetical protein